MRSFWFSAAVLLSALTMPADSGVLYTDKELWVAGQEWVTTRVMWERERLAHNERLKAIEVSELPDTHKEFMRRQEFRRHKQTSDQLALQRDKIQNVLIDESNARVKSRPSQPDAPETGHPSSTLQDTAGTAVGDPGHRGMAGDRDMGGGERTTQKMKEVLQDMGLYSPDGKGPLTIKETPGTLEIGDDFELTVNKTGLKPKPGTEFHRIKTEVDARNPETYLSESMKVRNKKGDVIQKDVGADFCEVQDHRKKASKGHRSDGAELVAKPDKMQVMAKGTAKTLGMGDVPDETLGKILKQNGITDSPEVFREKLWQIKEGKAPVTDVAEAEKLRKASQDIFNAAEQQVFNRTKRDIVDLRAKAEALPANHPDRIKIEEEIVDSVTKMKAGKTANDELIAAHRSGTRTTTPEVDVAGPKAATEIEATAPKTGKVSQDTIRRGTLDTPDSVKRVNVDAELEGMQKVYNQSDEGLGLKTFNVLTNVADIGQSCQTLEDYMEGKATLTDVVMTTADQFVTGGLIGTTKNAYESQKTYHEGASEISKANHTNMAAYLLQWELQFRKAGLSQQDARREISTAVLSGNLDHLKTRSQALIAQGKQIDPPKLIVETYDVSDEFTAGAYAWRTWDVVKGFAVGIGTGVGYTLLAPSRIVESWAEGELREAELEEYAATQEAHTRPAMFRKLLRAGIDSKRAREAISAWDEGKTGPLQTVFREARANIKARQPTPEQIAAAEAEADRIQAQFAKDAALLARYSLLINYLKWAPIELTQNPMPLEIAEEGLSEPLTLELTLGKPGQVDAACKEIESIIIELTGAAPKVEARHTFSCKGIEGEQPNHWRTQSPQIPGIYPVTGTLSVSVSGPSLAGQFAMLQKNLTREAFLGVDISLNHDKMDLHGEIWATLRKTPEISITMPASGYDAIVKPSGMMRFPAKHILETQNETFQTQEGEVTVRMTSDGAHVREVAIEMDCHLSETKDGPAFRNWKIRYKYQNLSVHEHIPLSETTPAEVTYWTAQKGDTPIGYFQEAQENSEGQLTWGKPFTILANTPGYSCWVSFKMTEKDRKAIWAREAELRNQKKQQQQTAKTVAGSGKHYSGPFAKKEGFEGAIEIDVSIEKKTVAAKFRSERPAGTDRKGVLAGEWIGTIDPATGQISAKIKESSMGTWRKREGSWYPPMPYDEESFSDDMKVVAKLEGDTVTGHFEMQGNQGFAFTATETKTVAEKKP